MRKRTVIAALAACTVVTALAIGAGAIGNALATPIVGTITAETVRGEPTSRLNLHTRFDNDAWVTLRTKGAIEVIVQRIEASPGSSFGWHSHPGENVNVVKQGTITLYHDDHCTDGVAYGPGSSFPTSPDETHLARNLGTEPLILFAVYFAPKTTPPLAVRLDQPLPAAGCPE
jgi:quercetin dioxygenase-like cupin family protein